MLMEEQLKRKVQGAIMEGQRIKESIQDRDISEVFPYSATILSLLERMDEELQKPTPDGEKLLRLAGGLGRAVTDDYKFSESPLGIKLLEIVSEIVRRYDPRFQN